MAKDVSTDGLVKQAELIADEYCGAHHDELSAREQVRWNIAFYVAKIALERRNAELEGLLHEVHGYVKHRSPDIANKISKALSHSSETPDDR